MLVMHPGLDYIGTHLIGGQKPALNEHIAEGKMFDGSPHHSTS